ncbi:DUF1492 domain-containing protein [Acetobacterium sp.]|uniref:DUF1492 domain-containing protein n=1 Tax=Acetobacterium sp. TaxID=1872094 RepID=UPI002F4299F3
MTAANNAIKEKLRQYKTACERIDDLEQEIEVWMAKATSITSMISDMPKGSTHSGFDAIVVKYLSICVELDNQIKIAVKIKQEIDEMILTIQDGTTRRIMQLRYINQLRWEEICVRTDYEWAQVHRYHSKGLEILNHDTQ